LSRDDHFRFGSVFIKKITKLKFFFWTKTGSNRFGLIFSVWLSFFCFGSVWHFFFWFGSIFLFQFGFFGFMLIKPKSNRTGRFFKILIGFFHGSVFSVISFPVFSVFCSPLVLSQLLLLFFRAHWHFLALVYLKVICEIALHSWMMICVSRS
jgi:hypothetical protein